MRRGHSNAACAVVAALAGSACAQPLIEHFDSVAALQASGWAIINHSHPLGSTSWFQGATVPFAPQSSAGFIAADFQSTQSLGTISTWLLLPERTIDNGDVLRFWTRTVDPAAYADRLQVRLSTSGASADVGAGPLDVGVFGTLLMDINPEYRLSGEASYPVAWTQFSITVSGLAEPALGRLAFRYFVENGGSNGLHSDFVGIDAVEFLPAGAELGRCCYSAGQCMLTSEASCLAIGGAFGGGGSSCARFTCPVQPEGACCAATGGCAIVTEAACTGAGGVYRGDQTECATAACPFAAAYQGKAVPIPDGSGSSLCGPWVAADIFVPLSFSLAQVDAAILLSHPWQGDVRVRLSKVDGPTVMLVDRPGRPQSAYGFSSSDFGGNATRYFRATDAASALYDLPAVLDPGIPQVSGSWKPEQPLSVFANLDTLGRWRLEACDCAGGEYGEIRALALNFTPLGALPCYANCDGSVVSPILGANDFVCFINWYATEDPKANCDASTGTPILTANDFSCFLSRFLLGCS